MKILTVNNTADIYGASRCLERVFGCLAEDGHEVHAVLPERGPLAALLEARGIQVHVHPGLSVVDRAQLRTVAGCLRFAFQLPLSVAFLRSLIVRLQIEAVHTNTVVMPSPPLAALLTRRPHVWHVRELLAEFGWLWKPYQRFVLALSSTVVAISTAVRDQFDRKRQGKIRVIYDGLDEAAGEPDPLRVQALRAMFPAAALLVGVVGRIKWHRKGQEVLVRAAAIVRKRYPETRYVVVGTPSPGNEDHETRLRELITANGLDASVTLLGDRDDPVSVFAALDMAVAPPVQPEPFGCVAIEAMAVGRPVVGSRAGGLAEQILDGETGFLFEPGDSEELARHLEILLGDPALRQAMGAAGKARVREHFSLEHTHRAMSEVFLELRRPRLAARPLAEPPAAPRPLASDAELVAFGMKERKG